jgi:hypothetical protein
MIIKLLNHFFYLIFLLCIVFCEGACKDKKGINKDMVKASPFDTTHFETQTLSAEDRSKLAAATGKTVKPMDGESLAKMVKTSTGKLYVYCFWNLQNAGSLSTLKALNVLSEKYDSSLLKVVFVNILDAQKVEDVNLFIRENQLTEESLILEKADMSFFSKKIRKDFTGITALPVLLMVNKAEQTMMFYNKPMDEKELTAMVQPLIL